MTLQDRCKKFALNFPASNSVDGKHVWNVDLIQSFAEEIRNDALDHAQVFLGARARIYLHGEPEKSELIYCVEEIGKMKGMPSE
jgi:hypothetical protein